MLNRVHEILKKLTLEEKASLCCGEGFWNTVSLPQHEIKSMLLMDGPHGVRKQSGVSDHLGINNSDKTTCFPTAACLASSWDRKLVKKVGEAIGIEAQAENVQIVLGPGANIKRSPLCGRNFEYFSEDPYLSGLLAGEHIRGMQSQGIGASLKHYAVNNQETKRFNIDVIIDERSLCEIYLSSFEGAIKTGEPWTVMCAYNKINGEYCSQNKKLLTDILKYEWGFKGFVVSDWFATSERDLAIKAGMDLEMPTSAGVGKDKIITAVQEGKISEEELNNSVARILAICLKSQAENKDNTSYEIEAHHKLARMVAGESIVLLKNDNDILPLNKKSKIAILGSFAKTPRYQGTGSSRINPTKIDIPFDEIEAKGVTIVESPADADVCIIFTGLPDNDDSEGVDRKNIKLPEEQCILIEETAKLQKNIIVVLANGSAIEMPWIDQAKGLLETYLGGQAMGGAVADILFGDTNPSGKLAESFPVKLNDTPSYINFPGDNKKVEYREGIFVGYRHYDKVDIEPLFPFGYGMSYTTFKYSDLQLDKSEINDTQVLQVKVKIKNTGNRSGKEAVQLYVKDNETSVIRPIKELKGFDKVSLEPGEECEIDFTLDKRAFAFYDVEIADWRVESGEFDIQIGKSSRDIQLSKTLYVSSTTKVKKGYTLDSTIADVKEEPAAAKLVGMMLSSSQAGSELGMDTDAILSSIKLRSLTAISQARGGTPVSEKNLLDLIDAMND